LIRLTTYILVIAIFFAFSSCTGLLSAIGNINIPNSKTRECCYIAPNQDTIYFNCRKNKLVRMQVFISKLPLYTKIFVLDSILQGQDKISLGFLTNVMPKDDFSGINLQVILTSDKRVRNDFWFILDSAAIKSNDTIYSYNKTGR
jgi:hypothetical protein